MHIAIIVFKMPLWKCPHCGENIGGPDSDGRLTQWVTVTIWVWRWQWVHMANNGDGRWVWGDRQEDWCLLAHTLCVLEHALRVMERA